MNLKLVNNIIRSKSIFVENIKIEVLFSNIYLDVLSKIHLQGHLYLQETR